MKTVNESAEVGAIVARFQVPELHEEHKALIQRVVNTHPRVFVILGLAADACKCTYNNPLDFPTRKAMVEKEFPTVEVLYIKDVGNDEIWSKELDRIITKKWFFMVAVTVSFLITRANTQLRNWFPANIFRARKSEKM